MEVPLLFQVLKWSGSGYLPGAYWVVGVWRELRYSWIHGLVERAVFDGARLCVPVF